MLEVDADAIEELAADPLVRSLRPVVDYQLDLAETVPYVGATAVQNSGYDGRGVRVAVLDSGIDYTHANLGGPGTVAAYAAAYGTGSDDLLNTTRDGFFPTAKVVEGYDFVGEAWPNGALAPDEDPIDADGHGTHVADILAGVGGVAPGASLYALKVCSAVDSEVQRRGAAASDGLCRRSQRRLRHQRSPGYRQYVAPPALRPGVQRRFVPGCRECCEGWRSDGSLAGNSGDKPFVVGSPFAAPLACRSQRPRCPPRDCSCTIFWPPPRWAFDLEAGTSRSSTLLVEGD